MSRGITIIDVRTGKHDIIYENEEIQFSDFSIGQHFVFDFIDEKSKKKNHIEGYIIDILNNVDRTRYSWDSENRDYCHGEAKIYIDSGDWF